MVVTCPSDNTIAIDQSNFWSHGKHWDAHRAGWAVAGACAAIATIITLITVSTHARNYRCPAEQRQIIRVLYMPMVYAIISFLSYRFFRDYTYYSLIQVVYEALTLSAFLMLLIQYVADTSSDASVETALKKKEKKSMPFPLSCFRYRPSKPSFMHAVKWAVLQYAFVRPVISIIALVCEAKSVLCPNQWSVHFANVYLRIVDLISIIVALYGLILFYVLMRDELAGRRPLAKFLSIKLIVIFTYFQGFIFDALQKRGIIKATQYWTTSNIVDGLNALVTCVEMVIFAGLMMWAYPATEYRDSSFGPQQGFGKALLHSINFSDFAREIYTSTAFLLTHRPPTEGKVDFDHAFRLDGTSRGLYPTSQGHSRVDSVEMALTPKATPRSEDGLPALKSRI